MSSPRADRHESRTVAYFSMEIGLSSDMPTYSGGLGVLAGDTLKAGADLGLPMIGISLVHRTGYLRQILAPDGSQVDVPDAWDPASRLEEMPLHVTVQLSGRPVHLRTWRQAIHGVAGHIVDVYFLDADLPENDEEHRRLTDRLYGGDARYRLQQEAILGFGGVALLRALGHGPHVVHHMNEGHSALLTIALLAERTAERGLEAATELDCIELRRRCVFTTHTPVPAGHDRFPLDMVADVLGEHVASAVERLGGAHAGGLDMTQLALNFSRYINGVAMRHGEVSRDMYPGVPINSITNGVHLPTWAAPPFARMFDHHMAQWRRNNSTLRHAVGIPLDEVAAAHRECKHELLREIESSTGLHLHPNVLTLGFARRATEYKRADLLFRDLDRLRAIARRFGGLQVVHAGKAHPSDWGGQAMIRRVVEAGRALEGDVSVVYLPGYDMRLASILTAGADVWLNTPRKPYEASGTSGMKAALNGVPSLSILDGWWIEGWVEGVTGWAIGDGAPASSDEGREAEQLLDKLEQAVLPAYHDESRRFAEIQRYAISLNASHFHAQRMLRQYAHGPYEMAYGGASEPVEDPRLVH
jgi:starch phosphorylase